MGIPLHTDDPNSSPCTKISTRCIIWQGADIPCIDLCKGDMVDDVISKLAVTICEISDLTKLDFSCLLVPFDPSPKNITEITELFINSICDLKDTSNVLKEKVDLLFERVNERETNCCEAAHALPELLYYTDADGNVVTQLSLNKYAEYLAKKLVDVIEFNHFYKQQQDLIDTKFDDLAVRVSILETAAETPPTITIISQGASYYIPGAVIPIDEGFYNFERTFLQHAGSVGTPADITNALAKQTSNLSNLPQLSNPDLFMKNFAGWINSPVTLADSFNNLWLTMTDLRNKVQFDINNTPLLPCIVVPILSQSITAITTTYATLNFMPNLLPTIQSPIGYKVEVFDHIADPDLLSPIHVVTITPTTPSTVIVGGETVNLVSTAFLPNVEYTIATTALYDCGESAKMKIISKLIVPTILYKLNYTITGGTPTPNLECKGTDGPTNIYTRGIDILTIELRNKITDALVITDVPINVTVRFRQESCAASALIVTFGEVTLMIQAGTSSVSYSYTAGALVPCINGHCEGMSTFFECGVSIDNMNVEFGTIPVCVP